MAGGAQADQLESWPLGCAVKRFGPPNNTTSSATTHAADAPAYARRSPSFTEEICSEKIQLHKLRVGLECQEYYTGFENNGEPEDEWSLQTRCCPKDQSTFTLFGEGDCRNGVSELKIMRVSTQDEPLAPASPRFSCQWDKVNREAYFNDLSSLESEDINQQYSYKLEENVLIDLENVSDESRISVKLTVVHSYVQETRFQDIAQPKSQDPQKGLFVRIFRTMFPWCTAPRVETGDENV